MQLVPAPDILDWIKYTWDQTLEWDVGNSEKLKKHGFSKDEVNESFAEDFILAGEVLGDWSERRFIIYSHIGLKYVTAACTIRNTKIRVISFRSARDNEKKDYQKHKKK